MELIILDQTTYLERRRFDAFASLAWNVKWPKGGDFQMRSYSVELAIEYFKKGEVVGIDQDDTVMQITEVSQSLDGNGSQYVEVRGESPLSIFDYRPAVREILSSVSYEAEYPDGWVYGDKLENTADVVPLQVAKELVHISDVNTYGRNELSYLSLPFTYVDTTARPVTDGRSPYPGDRFQYYEVSGTIGAALDELCDKGEFGMVVMRPNPLRNWYTPTAARPLGVFFYKPIKDAYNQRSTFSYLFDDIISSSSTYRLIDNVYIESREDYVAIVSNAQESYNPSQRTQPEGLTARVVYETNDIEGLDGYAYDSVDTELADKASSGEAGLLDISAETNGKFPFNEKNFFFNGQRKDYYLGDSVMVRTKGMALDTYVRVTSFIRTQDMNGYREYPEFGVDKKEKRNSYLFSLKKYDWN